MYEADLWIVCLSVLKFCVEQKWGNLEIELEVIQRRQVHVQKRHSQNTLTAALLRLMDYVINVFTPGLHIQGLSGPPSAHSSGRMSEYVLNT